MRVVFATVLAAVAALSAGAASGARVWSDEERSLEVFGTVQFWNVTSFDVIGADSSSLDDRSDFYIRRGRFGVRGQLRPDIDYRVWFAYDNLGKNAATSSPGTAQASSNKEFYAYDAYFTIRLRPDLAYLTVGYFRPQVVRESMTSPFKTDSFSKSLVNTYPRLHFVGRSIGRETGVNLGGLLLEEGWSLNYNLGVFDTNDERITGSATGGEHWAPLLAGRVAVTAGEPEMKRYGISYTTNTLGRRKGVTLGLSASRQGRTDQTFAGGKYVGGFDANTLYGADLLANWGPLNLDAEYVAMHREFTPAFVAVAGLPAEDYTDAVWHVRGGWNLRLPSGQLIEPVVMYSRFEGDDDSAVYPRGEEEILEAGLNWFIDGQSWYVSAFYGHQDGRPKSRFASNEVQDRGDFLGLGMTFGF